MNKKEDEEDRIKIIPHDPKDAKVARALEAVMHWQANELIKKWLPKKTKT